MAFVTATSSDSPDFIARVESVIARAMQSSPRELVVIRIDNWFDAKWAGFAGKVGGAFGVGLRRDLVVPPFVPGRVIHETWFRLSDSASAAEQRSPVHVHQTSGDNFRRSMRELFPETLLVWFSDQSVRNGRGSVMAYVPGPQGHEAWYADFAASGGWSARRLVGLTKSEILGAAVA